MAGTLGMPSHAFLPGRIRLWVCKQTADFLFEPADRVFVADHVIRRPQLGVVLVRGPPVSTP